MQDGPTVIWVGDNGYLFVSTHLPVVSSQGDAWLVEGDQVVNMTRVGKSAHQLICYDSMNVNLSQK